MSLKCIFARIKRYKTINHLAIYLRTGKMSGLSLICRCEAAEWNMIMKAYERFLNYVAVDTQSSPKSETTPTTETQIPFAKMLCAELQQMGISGEVDDKGYVYAKLPATSGKEGCDAIGFIAHMDTAPDFSGKDIAPIIHENYDGEDIALPKCGRVIRVEKFPFLKDLKGKTIITADGSTLLGGDDKAGVAEIMTACERIISEKIPHGDICIGFTPDEEVGQGADYFDVNRFGAKYAYTMDGGEAGGVEYENFNAAAAEIAIEGVSVHPGSAKGIMENALLIACEINSLLPQDEIPAKTERYEGFYHIDGIMGTSEKARMGYIIRDHDMAKFESRKETMRQAVDKVLANHAGAKIMLTIKDSYYNMEEKIKPCMHLIENARKAWQNAGIQPVTEPVRGGTDGSRLSYMGLPCPNLGTGTYNMHGPYELCCADDMTAAVNVILNIIEAYATAG